MTNDYMANVMLSGPLMADGSQNISLTPLHCFVGRHSAASAISRYISDAHYTLYRVSEPSQVTSSEGAVRLINPLPLRPLRIITYMGPPALGEIYPPDAAEVVEGLRKDSKTVQTLLMTNDPIIINELEPEEVSIVVDLDRGTGGGPTYRVTPISQTRNFADRIKAYKLGELWINYLHELGE